MKPKDLCLTVGPKHSCLLWAQFEWHTQPEVPTKTGFRKELHVIRLKISFYNRNKEPTFNAKELRATEFSELR